MYDELDSFGRPIINGIIHPRIRVVEIPLITESGLKKAEEEIKERERYERESKEYLKQKRINRFNKKRKEKLTKIDKIIKKYNLLFEDFYIYNKIKRNGSFFGNDIEKLLKYNIKFKILCKIEKEIIQYKIYVYDLAIYEDYKIKNNINNNNAYDKELELEKKYKKYVSKVLGKNYVEIKSLKEQKSSIVEEHLKGNRTLIKK